MTPEEFRRVTEVTYLGYMYGTLSALRRMAARDRGVIVQVGSARAYRAIPLQSAYCAAKHAVEGFTESLRCERLHDRSRVRVVMVQMPALTTPQFDWVKSRLPGRAQPVPPIVQPEVAARAVLWAADHDRKEMWVGWPTVKAILGNRVAPRLLDRYLAWTGYFDRQKKDYTKIPIAEQVEVLSLAGDIALDGGEPKVHAHIVVGKADGTAHGGHLMAGHGWPTLELILTEPPGHLRRRMDPETGLALLDAA